jgi:argininosuccinate lyase
MAILTTMKGLPLSYNRDMQEDKSNLFSSIDDVWRSLALLTSMVPLIKFNKNRLSEIAGQAFSYATDIADYLVKKGCPFREAHHIVGSLVYECDTRNIDVMEMPIYDLKRFSELFEDDIYEAIKIENCINAKNIIGGTAKKQVEEQIYHWKVQLGM